MSDRIADSADRRAALDPGRSFICQAPAGAGKTGLLTQRFLRLLSTVDEPEEILAITFTRKAAAEMRNRILSALRNADSGPAPEDDYARVTHSLAGAALERSRQLGWSLPDNPGRLQVRTIDSLCHGLARQLPLLSRSGGPALAVDDAAELYRAAARRTLALVDDPDLGASVSALLAHLDNNPQRAEALLAAMLARRDQWLRHLGGGLGDGLSREALEAGLKRLVDDALSRLEAALPGAMADALWTLMQFAREHLPEDKCDSPLGRWDGGPPADGGEEDRLARWRAVARFLLRQDGARWVLRKQANADLGFPAPSGTKDAGDKARFKEAKNAYRTLVASLAAEQEFVAALGAVPDLPDPRYPQAQWLLLEQLPALLNLAYAQLRLIFSERGTTDHTEVNSAAAQALGPDDDPTDLALALDYRLRHILVDEFQDTSRTQFDLLCRLTAGWLPGDGHSFFAVGDPMQSIYRFRQAEVGLFLEARERGLGHLPLASLVLKTNFRSCSQIIDWVNTTFARVFPSRDDCDRGAIRYTPAEAFRSASADGGVLVHPLLDSDAEREAALVTALVRDAMQSGQQSIAVLARSRSHLHAIAAALANCGIAYQAVDVQRLGERLAVRELRALVRALVLPHDRAAWLSLLRAPWCGLSLADLSLLVGDDPRGEVIRLLEDANRLAGLSADGARRAAHVRRILLDALRHRRRRGLRETVEAAWLALGGPACLQSAADLAAARVFLDLVSRHEQSADLPLLQGLDEALVALYAPPDPGAPSTVQLMTVHKAKGLEFDTVILPGLGRATRGNERELVQWLEWEGGDGQSYFVLAPIAESEGGQDPLEQLLRRTEQEKQTLETARLLYVAATRARRSLHLIGAVRPTGDRERFGPRRDTLLHPLWPVVEAAYLQALDAAQSDAAGPAQEAAPTIRYPALVRAVEPWRPPAPSSALPMQSREENALIEPEYEWAGSSARHIGTLIHRYLEHIARDGLALWNAARIEALRHSMEDALSALGVGRDSLEEATTRVIRGLCSALSDERGRWILSDHSESRCEYALTAVFNERPLNLVIDRTFIDADGVRWIIDYKTGSHEGGRIEEFLDREQERYRPQLERYAEVMGRLHPDQPIRLGLYFPLLGGWREWQLPGRDA